MQAREADTGSVVWVGDLGPRVTDAALRNAFSQVRCFARRAVACGVACAALLAWALASPAPDARAPQFGDVADARLVHDVFTRRPTGCGWVRFREPERAAAVLQRCNVTALYIVGALRRHVRASSHAPADVARAQRARRAPCWSA
jgi:hypothetical protein